MWFWDTPNSGESVSFRLVSGISMWGKSRHPGPTEDAIRILNSSGKLGIFVEKLLFL